MDYDRILKAMAYAFFFQATDEKGNMSQQDIQFENYVSKGLNYVLENVCGFNSEKEKKIIVECMRYYQEIIEIELKI